MVNVFVLPVIDLLNGQAVLGRAGKRAFYRPIAESVLSTTPANPVALAAGIQERLGISECYLADLNAIAGGELQLHVVDQILGLGMTLWLDAGITSRVDVLDRLAGRSPQPAIRWILGLETLVAADGLPAIVELLGADHTVVSLDLDGGQPRVAAANWQAFCAEQIAEDMVQNGVRQFIVLDLTRVGMQQGIGTNEIVRNIRALGEPLTVLAGGGIATLEQVHQLADDGADGVLLATSLHQGAIGRDQIRRLANVRRA